MVKCERCHVRMFRSQREEHEHCGGGIYLTTVVSVTECPSCASRIVVCLPVYPGEETTGMRSNP